MSYTPVTMLRGDLENLPSAELPGGYTLRFYQPGDRATWVRIWRTSDDMETYSPQRFDKEFGCDETVLARRMMFLLSPAGEPCGTITAWPEPAHAGLPWGRVHWVAITPPHRRRGLARPMLAACLTRMKALGHVRAMLGTQTVRIPAINLYLSAGFVPEITDEASRAAWAEVAATLDHPALRHAK
jgi:GNAT superfamily N-acetyltransferase